MMKKQMQYKNLVMYFLSGTGNSYRMTKQMGEVAEENGLTTIVSPANSANPKGEITDNKDCLLGLVFPTHGFTAPWYIIKFALRLPRRRSTHAFCVATRAGLRFGKLFTPGISGSATFLIALILAIKGYRVRGVTGIDMPSNWYSLHPIQKEKSVSMIIQRAQEQASSFINKTLAGKRRWLTKNNLYEAIWTALLTPISFGYIVFGRFFLARLFFANTNCDGCGICSKGCPVQAIDMKGVNNPRPFWKYYCESCMRCAAFCPKNAIEAGHSWSVILWMICTIPVSFYLFGWLKPFFPGLTMIEGRVLKESSDIAFYYLSLSISYYLFHQVMRIPLINRLFARTTLTHLRFWGRYREPDTKLIHLLKKKE
jgi:ferredoxin